VAPDALRIGEQGDTEQAVDPGVLEGGPPGLSGQGVAGQHQLRPEPGQLVQRDGGLQVHALLADQVTFTVDAEGAAVM
jgi:hypothetical protein